MTSYSKLAQVSALAILSFVAMSASAQTAPSKIYGEVGYTMLSYKEVGYKAEPGILRAVIGTEIHPNANLEAMLGFGITEGTTSIRNVTVTSKVDRFWGLYVRPKVMISPEVELFGRLGYASSKITVSVPGFALSDSGSSLSYGAGVSFKVAQNTSIVADYMSYYSKDGVKATGLSLGLGFKF